VKQIHATPTFKEFQDQKIGGEFIDRELSAYAQQKIELFKRWYKQSGEAGEIYPSQGLLSTPFDYVSKLGKTILSDELLWDALQVRWYLLALMNHSERLDYLKKVESKKFSPPPKISSRVMECAQENGLALAIGDLGAVVVGHKNGRISRRDLLVQGPFTILGKYARIPFAGSAMPDVFGAPAAIATMAMCHALVSVPRNGVFSDIKRQVDLVKSSFEWLKQDEILHNHQDRKELVKRWKRNIMGVIEAEMGGKERASLLYEAGVRTFRVYSPEPGRDVIKMVEWLRNEYGNKIEIFAGQVTAVFQAKELEQKGADGLYIGIGGGGRCITAVRSGSVVDWPNLLWQLRGEIQIPVIVEGGASDHVGVTLMLGATGIGVSRIAAGGTIESPGGLLYLVDQEGIWFKPYGGEASARTKYQDNKMLALGIPAFVEGETTKAVKAFIPHVRPTLVDNMYYLLEDLVLSLVFRGVSTIKELQAIDPSPLRRITGAGQEQQYTH
jgi:hypothetical protein